VTVQDAVVGRLTGGAAATGFWLPGFAKTTGAELAESMSRSINPADAAAFIPDRKIVRRDINSLGRLREGETPLFETRR